MENEFEKEKRETINRYWKKLPPVVRTIIIIICIVGSLLIAAIASWRIFSPSKKTDKKEIRLAEVNVNDQTGFVSVDPNFTNYMPEVGTSNGADEILETLSDPRNMDKVLMLIQKRQIVESITYSEDDKIQLIERPKGPTFVVIKLDEVAIPNSVELSWDIYSQPANSYSVYRNIILFNWRDPADMLKSSKSFSVRYIAANPESLDKLEFIKTPEFLYVGDWIGFRLSDGAVGNVVK